MSRGRSKGKLVKRLGVDDPARLCHYGCNVDHSLNWGIACYSLRPRDASQEYSHKLMRDFQVKRLLLDPMEEALRSGDASHFRRLADAIEARVKNPVDPLRSYLLEWYRLEPADPKENLPPNFFGKPRPRLHGVLARELRDFIHSDTGMDHTEWHIRRVCKQLGIPLGKAQIGRPKKTRSILAAR